MGNFKKNDKSLRLKQQSNIKSGRSVEIRIIV